LEDFGGAGTAGSHWEVRVVGNEYMVGYINPLMPVSGLTLSLFEDMGWYRSNYSAQEYWGWGKDQGCDFLDRCETSWPNKEGYCTATTTAPLCTPDRVAKGVCDIDTYTSDLVPYYQHFTNPLIGGADFAADYCPYVSPYSNRYCADPANSEPGNIYGYGSRCWPTATTAGPFTDATCLRFNCLNESQLQVEVNAIWYNCPSSGGSVSYPGGFVSCPLASLFCRGVINGDISHIPAPPQGTDSVAPSGNSKSGICFIATAAFGSEMHPKVWKLRLFRDQWLAKSHFGRLFIDFYYHVSPPIANWISEHDWARVMTRGILWPVVFTVEKHILLKKKLCK